MKAQVISLALLAALTIGGASEAQPLRLAQTTVERESELMPDKTPGRSDINIKQKDGLLTKRTEIDANGHVDSNDKEFAGLGIGTWFVISLVLLVLVIVIPTRRRRTSGEGV